MRVAQSVLCSPSSKYTGDLLFILFGIGIGDERIAAFMNSLKSVEFWYVLYPKVSNIPISRIEGVPSFMLSFRVISILLPLPIANPIS
ncbi:hypothetical protein D3C84_897680 [compost metagenome]